MAGQTGCEHYSPSTGECRLKHEHCPGWMKYGRCDGDCPKENVK